MDRVIVDTQFLISLFLEESRYYKEARDLIKNSFVHVPVNIFLEFTFLLVRSFKLDKEKVYEIVDAIFEDFIILDLPSAVVREAYELIKRRNLSCGFINDAILLALAKNRGFTLITFDKRLRKLAKEEGARVLEV